jgi:sulfoacetaldehyde dehydrogenase
MDRNEAKAYVQELVARASAAQKIAEGYDQARVNELCAAVAWECCKEDFRRAAAKMLVEESRMGREQDKFNKILNKVKGVWRDMKDEISVGIVETDIEKQIVKYIKPVGVIAALIPITNGEATPCVKALWALKSRNAIIMSPHPRGKKTLQYVTEYIRAVLKKYGAPEDLVMCVEPEMFAIEVTHELMAQCDYIAATGGTPMVRVAYSSGTPAVGVGTGNVVTYVDTSADLKDAAHKIMLSKTFDNATSCSSENEIVVHEAIYDEFIKAMEAEGGYLVKEDSPEKEIIIKTMWPKWHEDHNNHDLTRDLIAKTAPEMCKAMGLKAPEDVKFIMVEENGGIGKDYPLTGEKLSVIATLIKCKSFEDAMDKMEACLNYMGNGHSCGIHTKNDEQVDKLARRMTVSRIMVNQPQSLSNSGSWGNGMRSTMTLGCGTWGYNSTSDNVTWKHFVNYTVVSKPIEAIIPPDEELFPEYIRNK